MNLSLPTILGWPGKLNGQALPVPRVRWNVLLTACQHLREGRFDEARELMITESDLVPSDAPCLNLLGVLALSQSNWDDAARLWRQSICADRTYIPPRRNLRRYFELFQFGRSNVPLLLGDEPESFARTGSQP